MSDDNNNSENTAGEQSQAQMKKLNINMFEMLDLSAGILNRAFIQGQKDKAKSLFKELKGGKQYPMGTLTFNEDLKVDFKLALDYSEFVGAGFNFDVFQAALFNMLQRIHAKLKAKEPIDLLSGDRGVAINMPGAVQTPGKEGGQVNVLFMAIDFPTPSEFILRLMFVDPEQFRREPEEGEAQEQEAQS